MLVIIYTYIYMGGKEGDLRARTTLLVVCFGNSRQRIEAAIGRSDNNQSSKIIDLSGIR